jgi:asparagine N-glycosylation enzyme membrane subunit Stt3
MRFAIGRGVGPRLAALGGAVLVVVTAILFVRVFPHGRGLMRQLIGVKSDLVREQGDVTWQVYWRLGGPLALAAWLAPLIAVVDAARGRDPRFRVAAVIGGALMPALWIRTHDYGYVAGPMLVFLGTMTVVRLFELARPVWLRVVLALAGATAVAVPIFKDSVQRPLLPNSATGGLMLLTDGWVQALGWMRAHTPALTLPLDATLPSDRPFHHPKGNYGVLAFWDWGHYIADLGERPPLASGGISGSIAHWYFIVDEDEAVKALRERLGPDDQVRYVFADARTEGDFVLAALQMAGYDRDDFIQGYAPVDSHGQTLGLWLYNDRFYRSIGARLYDQSGDGLGHFRMVYASRERTALAYISKMRDGANRISRHATVLLNDERAKAWRGIMKSGKPTETPLGLVYQVEIEPSVKLFEVVAGAHLVGTAPPGAKVEARLDLRAPGGLLRFAYHRAATADAAGRYELIVPYATAPEPSSDVVAVAPYTLAVDGKDAEAKVQVAPADVVEGRTVAVP